MDNRWIDVPQTIDNRWEDIPNVTPMSAAVSTIEKPISDMADRFIDITAEPINKATEVIKNLFTTTGKAITGQPEAISDTATQANKIVKPFYKPIPTIEKWKENMKSSIPGKGIPTKVARTAIDFTIPTTPVDVGLTAIGTGALEAGANAIKPFTRKIGDLLKEKGVVIPKEGLKSSIPGTIPDETTIKSIVQEAGGKNPRISDYGNGNKFVEFEGVGDTTLTHKIDEVNTVDKVKSLLKEKETMFNDIKSQTNTRFKSYPQTVKKIASPELSKRLGGEYPVKPNIELEAKAKQLIEQDRESALNRVLTEIPSDETVAMGGELIKYYDSHNMLSMSEKITNTLDPQLRAQGRSIQAVALLKNFSPDGIVNLARRRLNKVAEKFPNWAPKLKIDEAKANELRSMAETAQKLPDGEEKLIALNNLNQKINSYIPSSIADKAIALWKAGLLTGLKTSGGNILSNTTNAALETISKTAAVPYDMALSILSGKRSITSSGEGYIKGFKEGIDRGATFFKTGFDPRRGNPMLKYDQVQVNFDSPILKKYTETVFRNMGAQDQPFYYGALKASIIEQTKVQGINKGLSGKGLDAFVKRSLEAGKIPEETLKNAINDAQIAVYTNDTQLGKIGQAIQRTGPLGQAVIPFAKTPAAVAMQVVNYTPAGAIKPIIDGVYSGITRGTFNQREIAQALGRVTTGAPILYLGKKLYDSGRITLGMPKSERERKQMELEGKTPNSIRIGDRNYSLNYFGPAGNLLIIGAYFQKALDETGSKSQALAQSVAGAGKSVTDQTFLQGLSGVLDAINDPSRFGEFMLSSTAGSVVPTIVGDVAKATDPYQRIARDKGNLPKSMLMNIESKIPGVRESLPKRYDIFGKDMKNPSGPVGSMIDVTRSAPIRNQNDKTVQELSTLAKNPESISTPTEIKSKQTVAGKQIEIPTKDLYDINKHVGMEVKNTFDDFNQNPNYAKLYDNLSPEQKALIYNNISSNIKAVNVIKYAISNNLIDQKQGTYELYKLANGDKAKLVNFISGKYFVPLDIIKLITQGRIIKKGLTGKIK